MTKRSSSSASAIFAFGAFAAIIASSTESFSPIPVGRASVLSTSSRVTTRPLHFSFFSNEEEARKTTEHRAEDLFDWVRSPRDSSEESKTLRELVGRDGTDRSELDLGDSSFLTGIGLGAALLASIAAVMMGLDVSLPTPHDVMEGAQYIFQNPTAVLESLVSTIQDMGPLGIVFFSAIYITAEVLLIPALPLTASAGYLFGVAQGTGVVLFSATIAATISFFIGRTLLRSFVEEKIQDSPKFLKLDKAIGKEGLKLMLLLRVAPVFPFALSNYLYGASSVGFAEYFLGTLLGFAPGTIAYVYTGSVGKALALGNGGPWYLYAGGFILLAGLLKLVADVATNVLEELEEQES